MNIDSDKSEFEQSLPLIKGTFNVSDSMFIQKVNQTQAFLFDWDGVFNLGIKGGESQSGFAEPDSMGINMLRFAYWLNNNKKLPFVGIITGENNPIARKLAQREHFNAVFSSVGNKVRVLQHLNNQYNIHQEGIAFTFDDVLDIGLAEKVGLRFLVNRVASPIFLDLMAKGNFCDYITDCQGNNCAVREISDLYCAAIGQFKNTILMRSNFHHLYQDYLGMMQKVEVSLHNEL